MTIAFTGATGQLGSLVAEELLKREKPENLVALVRDPAKASALADRGVDVRHFDYTQPDALAAALDGVDRLLLISGNEIGQRVPQHQAVIDAATRAGVGFFAYTSFLHADEASIIGVAPEHVATENLLAAAPFTVALLLAAAVHGELSGHGRQAAGGGVLVGAADGGRISSATREDFAEAAAIVLTGEAVAATYELAGDTAWSLSELAATITDVTGKPVDAKNVSAAELTDILNAAGQPAPLVGFLVSTDQAIAAGELEDPAPGELSRLLGRPTTPLRDVVAGWLA